MERSVAGLVRTGSGERGFGREVAGGGEHATVVVDDLCDCVFVALLDDRVVEIAGDVGGFDGVAVGAEDFVEVVGEDSTL